MTPAPLSNDQVQELLKKGQAKTVAAPIAPAGSTNSGKPLTDAEVQAALSSGKAKRIKGGPAPEAPVTPPAPAAPNLGELAAEQYKQGGEKIKESIVRGGSKFAALTSGENANDSSLGMEFRRTGALLESALGSAAGATQAVFAPFTATTQKVFETLGVPHLIKAGYDALPEPAKASVKKVSDWAEANPDAARNLVDAITVTTAALGAEGKGNFLNKDLKGMGKAYATPFKDVAEATRNLPDDVKEAIAPLGENMQKKAVAGLEDTYTELLTGTKGRNAKLFKSQQATIAKNAGGTVGKPPEKILAEAGIVPRTGARSRLETLEQAADFKKSVEPLAKINRSALREVEQATQPIALDDLETQALKLARSTRNIDSGAAPDLTKEVKASFQALREEYGPTVSITKLDDIKSARWGNVKFDSTRPFRSDADYLIAKAAQGTIEDTAAAAGFDDVAQLNRLIGDRLEAAKFLASIDGQVMKGGQLKRYVFSAVGSTFGNTIPGKIAGALGGDLVAKILIDNSVAGPVRRLILRGIEQQDPAAYTSALKWLDDQNVIRSARLALPAGTPGANVINEGRPIIAAQPGTRDFVGKDVAVSRYTPAPKPAGTPARPAVMDLPEPYVPHDQLPVIDAGPKAPASPLPIAKGAPAVFSAPAAKGADTAFAATAIANTAAAAAPAFRARGRFLLLDGH